MAKEILAPKNVYKPDTPYSLGIKVDAGKLLFIAGQTPCDTNGETVGINDATAQTTQALENLKTVLAAGGATLEDITLLKVYMTRYDDIPKVVEVRRKYFPKEYPAVTLCVISSLARKEWLVEIEAIAVVRR
jgi:enamine deaminase RidA (YjgF/YER057c/UK114 family)